MFNQLLFRRGVPYFCAFDLLWLNGRDLREHALVERKRLLCGIVPASPSRVLYVDHLERQGIELFRAACERDLEGIVAKRKDGAYLSDQDWTTWLKIKNPSYSQAEGRHELFEKRERRLSMATAR